LKVVRIAALFLVWAGGLVGAQAQQRLVVDPARSEVRFTLDDALHTVHGTFRVQQGEVQFNKTGGAASGMIVVDAVSGKSGSSSRDGRMAKEELKVESYKTVSFAPVRIIGELHSSGDSTLQVHGVFTLLGTPHEIDVPMQVQVDGKQIHAVGTFLVPYVQWGLKDPSNMFIKVNKEVTIDLSLMGTLQ
jgi:polyisoprenoid-binding protein YceI